MMIDYTHSFMSRSLFLFLCCFLLSVCSLNPVLAKISYDRTGDKMVTSADLPILLGELVNNPDAAEILFQIADIWGQEEGPVTIDFKDYFPLSQNSHWNYVGFNGGSEEDNFTWTVEDTLQAVGGDRLATRIRTNTQEPTDDRNLDVDFWYCNSASREVYFYGLHVGTEKGSNFKLIVQDIILTDPLLVGTNGMVVGVAAPSDSAVTKVKLKNPSNVVHDYNATFSVTVNPTGIIPVFNTPLGDFTDVLRVVIKITAVSYGYTYTFENSTFFLKKDVGMVAQDQEPDEDDAQIQGILAGQVNGVTITAN